MGPDAAYPANCTEQRRRSTVLKVEPDSRTWSYASFDYFVNARAGFLISSALYVLATGSRSWQIAGWYLIAKSEGGGARSGRDKGVVSAISMEVLEAAEHWCLYDHQGKLKAEWVPAYVKDFWPSTVVAVSGEDMPSPDQLQFVARNTSTSSTIPFYTEGGLYVSGGEAAMDLPTFLQWAVDVAKRIPERVESASGVL